MRLFWRIRKRMRLLQLALLIGLGLVAVAQYDWVGNAGRLGAETATPAPIANSRNISGRATVIDGDTLRLRAIARGSVCPG